MNCLPSKIVEIQSHSPSSLDFDGFATRKTLKLRVPHHLASTLSYDDQPLPAPSCPLPEIPSLIPPHSSSSSSSSSSLHPILNPISPPTLHAPGSMSNLRSESRSRLRYLRRPISFITPQAQTKLSLACSSPALSSHKPCSQSSRPCITPELKRSGHPSIYSLVLPKPTPSRASPSRRWNRALPGGIYHFPHHPTPSPEAPGRESLESMDDPFRADAVVIQTSQTGLMSSSMLRLPSTPPDSSRMMIKDPSKESSEGSSQESPSPSSILDCSTLIKRETSLSSSTCTTAEINRSESDSLQEKMIKSTDRDCMRAETFVFGRMSRLDGFFHHHPRQRTFPTQASFQLQISPGPSEKRFRSGDLINLKLKFESKALEEIRVRLLGRWISKKGKEVHEFLRLENFMDLNSQEMDLVIPNRRTCGCRDCEEAKFVLPGSIVNQHVSLFLLLSFSLILI